MKKSLSQAIALATLLGASVTAQAAIAPDTNENGVGSALLFPLYTVDNNNSTLLSVTNTTEQIKAVKVRFLEGMNSAEVLDFHLYLSPQDVWSGTIVATADGAKLISNDTSCIVGMKNGFPKAGLDFRMTEINKDGDAEELRAKSRTRVGHFEVIEMGNVEPSAVIAFAGGKPVTAQEAIVHTATGKPGNCAAVTDAWNAGGRWHAAIEESTSVSGILAQPAGPTAPTVTSVAVLGTAAAKAPAKVYVDNLATTIGTPGAWVTAIGQDLSVTPATGGLYGTAAIVNVADSFAVTYDATAMTGIYENPQHPYPGTIFPHLLSGVNPQIGTYGFDNGANSSTVGGAYVASAPLVEIANNAVTAALVKNGLYNDYYVDPALAAQTDFVISFPTKRFHVNAKDAAGKPVVGDAFLGQNQLAPFTNAWAAGKSCDPVTITYYDKEEASDTVELEHISPLPDVNVGSSLCYETNIFGLNDSNIFGGASVRNNFELADGFKEGWMGIDLTHDVELYNSLPGATTYGKKFPGTTTTDGLPVVGFSAITTKNGVSDGGVVKNFGQSFNHKYN